MANDSFERIQAGLKDALLITQIARVCHEANRAWCEANGDTTQKGWDDAEDWQKVAALKGVTFLMKNPDAPASTTHDEWSEAKVADGWVYGPVKDGVKKTHPCLVPFEDLPEFEQAKDRLFKAVVNSLNP